MEATIKAGQILKARSGGDYDCVYTAEILDRKGAFVTVKSEGREPKRMKVHTFGEGEFIYALGKHSMCPIFRATN